MDQNNLVLKNLRLTTFKNKKISFLIFFILISLIVFALSHSMASSFIEVTMPRQSDFSIDGANFGPFLDLFASFFFSSLWTLAFVFTVIFNWIFILLTTLIFNHFYFKVMCFEIEELKKYIKKIIISVSLISLLASFLLIFIRQDQPVSLMVYLVCLVIIAIFHFGLVFITMLASSLRFKKLRLIPITDNAAPKI